MAVPNFNDEDDFFFNLWLKTKTPTLPLNLLYIIHREILPLSLGLHLHPIGIC